MLEVMLCGAADTHAVAGQFAEVVLEFGGDPWHYQSGRVLHINSGHANWVANSRATVQKADLCVFVVMEQYGDITWSVELETALSMGKPFLIFCLRETYRKYITLLRSITDQSAIADEGERRLVETLRALESDRQLTVVGFDHGYFKDELRRQMAALFSQSLTVMENRNQRFRVLSALSEGARLSAADRELLVALSTDETEDKNARKRALSALAESGGVDEDDLKILLESMEEGVQRLTIMLLPKLAPKRPVDPELLSFCVSLANASDDVGVARRLIPIIFEMDLKNAVNAMESLSLDDIGARRRLAGALEEHEVELVALGLRRPAVDLAKRCAVRTSEAGWLKRLEELISRLSDS